MVQEKRPRSLLCRFLLTLKIFCLNQNKATLYFFRFFIEDLDKFFSVAKFYF